MSASAMKCLVLDAMGVIFESADNVTELLFVDDRAKNVQAALGPGIDSILFAAESGFTGPQRRLSSRICA